MPLFSSKACFSPSVPSSLRKAWVKNGGTLTHSASDFREAKYFFCNGPDDPWLNELLSRSLVVRHASWIAKCVQEQFLMPIAAYTLDDDFDQSRIEPSSNSITMVNPSQQGPPLALSHQVVSPLPASLLEDMLTLLQSTPVSSLPAVFAKRLPAVTRPATEETLLKQSALKRPHTSDDAASSNVKLPVKKKQRIHPLVPDSNLETTSKSALDPTDNANKGEDRLNNPHPTSQDRASNTPVTNHLNVTPLTNKPKNEIANDLKPQHKLPTLLSLLAKSKREPQFKFNKLRNKTREKTNEQFARLIKPFDPASLLCSSPTPREPWPRCTMTSHAHGLNLAANPNPAIAKTKTVSGTNSEKAHTMFWENARNSYSGEGALVLSVNDILQAHMPTIQSTLFIANGMYLDKQFLCHAF